MKGQVNKVKLTLDEFKEIKDMALDLYKDRNASSARGADVFWGECAAMAVVAILKKNDLIDFELDVPSPGMKLKRE